MQRSLITIDLAAIRHNVRTLRELLTGAELWAVVKADGYGHGASDVGRVALEEGATALCVATVPEALELRSALPDARILVLGDTGSADLTVVREARLELGLSTTDVPEGVPVHLKLDTGMGRRRRSRTCTVTSRTVRARSGIPRPTSTLFAAASRCTASLPSARTPPKTGCGPRSAGSRRLRS